MRALLPSPNPFGIAFALALVVALVAGQII